MKIASVIVVSGGSMSYRYYVQMYRVIHNVHISLVFFVSCDYLHKHQQSKTSKKKDLAAGRVRIQSSNASCLQEAECTWTSFRAKKTALSL